MNRISSNQSSDNMLYHLKSRESRMNALENQIGSQKKILNLRDSPLEAAQAVRLQSKLTRLDQYSSNISHLKAQYATSEAYISETTGILQRVRELAVQGAQGTYAREDMKYMAIEVNELLAEMVDMSNGRDGEGNALFSGDKLETDPFRIYTGRINGVQGQLINNVQYRGSSAIRQVEISDGNYADSNFPGNQVFWAEQQVVVSSRNAGTFQVSQDSSVFIDGTEVYLEKGDNIHAVVAKINDSDAAVRAGLDQVSGGLVLKTTEPHQLWLEDGQTQKVFADLGVLATESSLPPYNYNRTAEVTGGSVFDAVIHLRNSLLSGDHIMVGGSGLKGIDQSLDNLMAQTAKLGALDERTDMVIARMDREVPALTEQYSNVSDLDITEAITELKMLEVAHKAALQTASRLIQTTLMDYLR